MFVFICNGNASVAEEGSKSNKGYLTLPTLYISESCIEIKITYIFIFTLLFGASNSLMKAFKAFMKHLGPSQRSVKIKV